MPVCAAAVGGARDLLPGARDRARASARRDRSRLLAKMPTIAAYCLQALDRPAVHLPAQPPRLQRQLPAHDVRDAVRGIRGRTRCSSRALDLLLILHADHEQNCSTSTVRMVGSSQANLFASISAGISALWGPLHGGANQQVIEMLERIEAEERRRARSSWIAPRTRTDNRRG